MRSAGLAGRCFSGSSCTESLGFSHRGSQVSDGSTPLKRDSYDRSLVMTIGGPCSATLGEIDKGYVSPKKGGDMNLVKARIRMGYSLLACATLIGVALLGTACNKTNSNYRDRVKTALEQADLKDVTVTEDANKNTITLGGTLHSDDAKNRAGNIAQASAGSRVIANEISVEPVGNEGQARKMESSLDDGIENNFKAVLISKGLDKQNIRYKAKNGVLTLKGSVKSPTQRQEAQELAKNTPNVQQVVNEIQVQR
jgi:hyperosmotically inducible periplasmic protein